MTKEIKRLEKLLSLKERAKNAHQKRFASLTEQIKLIQWQIDQESHRIQRFKREYLNLMKRYDTLDTLTVKDMQQRDIYAQAVETKMMLAKNALAESAKKKTEQEDVQKGVRQQLLKVTQQIEKIDEVKQQRIQFQRSTLESRLQSNIEERHAQKRPQRSLAMNTTSNTGSIQSPTQPNSKMDAAHKHRVNPARSQDHSKAAHEFASLMNQQDQAAENIDVTPALQQSTQQETTMANSLWEKALSQPSTMEGQERVAAETPMSLNTNTAAISVESPGSTAHTDVAQYIAQQVEHLSVNKETSLLAPDPEMHLKLSDPSLNQTQLTLARSASGWAINASGSSREQLELLRTNSARLLKRFTESGLGDVSLTTELKDTQHAFQSA